ncbi:MAG TPA: hypothetical protein VJR89_00085, partial [Polyangiales bacterium]|nr:hypothetical protein [Polyangiales bacterium]
KPAAGDGGSSAAGEGGSDAVPPPDADAPPPPDITGRRWDCLNLLISCSCIAFPDDEVGGGVCRTKYPCCYSKLVDDNDNPDCLCEPASAGGACPDHGSSSSWRLVDWCPGQLR